MAELDQFGGIVLAVGNRTNVLVKAGAPGTYQLRNFPIENGRNPAGVLPGDVVATVIVVADPFPMNLPPEPLPVSACTAETVASTSSTVSDGSAAAGASTP